jgi:hypothetical protein
MHSIDCEYTDKNNSARNGLSLVQELIASTLTVGCSSFHYDDTLHKYKKGFMNIIRPFKKRTTVET